MIRLLALCCLVAHDGGRGSDAPAAAVIADRAVGSVATARPSGDTNVYPLKQWMWANLSRPTKTRDFEVLARALSVVAANAPAELPEWAGIAERGAREAAARDLDRVRTSCTDCHDKYRASYRERLRTHPYPFER